MEVVKYDVNKAEIAKMSDLYLGLTISDTENKEEFAQVHSARMTMVAHRTSVNKLRLSTNKGAQNFIKTNNKDAQELIALMEPVESHLAREEKKVTDEQKRIQAEKVVAEKAKVEGRVAALFAVSVNIPYFEVSMLADSEFETMLDEATNQHMTERLRLQTEEKAKEEEKAMLEAERANQKAETERLAKQKAEQEAAAELVRIEQETRTKAIAEKEANIEAERKAFEDEKKKEQERKDSEEFERKTQIEETGKARFESLKNIGYLYFSDDLGTMSEIAYSELYESHKQIWDKNQKETFLAELEAKRIAEEKAATEKAEIAAAEKVKTEMATRAEEKRIAALRPDKEKLKMWINLFNFDIPALQTPEAKDVYDMAVFGLKEILRETSEKIKEL